VRELSWEQVDARNKVSEENIPPEDNLPSTPQPVKPMQIQSDLPFLNDESN